MIKVKDKQFDINVKDVVETVRSEVLIRRDKQILADIKPSVRDLMVTCPVHSNGAESKPSCGINVDTGVFHCFTCGVRGGLDTFISYCFGYQDGGNYGFEWLVDHYEDSTYLTRKGFTLKSRNPDNLSTSFVSEEELDSYRYYHDYMWKRKLTPELVEKFDVGYDPNFTLENKTTHVKTRIPCLTFPVKDISGNVIFIARRAINTKLFHYPQTANKPIYALNECIGSKTIYICESILNALTLWKYGLPAVALLGTGSESQINTLKHCGFRKLVLCLDGDKAGDRGIKRIFDALGNITKVSYVKMPRDGRDINDLTEEEFFNLKEIDLN